MAIKLNRKLNLVLDVEGDKGTVHIHSMPISRIAFEENFLTIARTFTAFYANGLGPVSGPRVAKLMLLREADAIGESDKVKTTLLPEIERLTNVIVPSETGRVWETIPFRSAIQRGFLDDEAAGEVENALVYFTCASSIHLKSEIGVALDGLRQLWGAATTSLNATDFMNSLPISTPAETTGAKQTSTIVEAPSSIPT